MLFGAGPLIGLAAAAAAAGWWLLGGLVLAGILAWLTAGPGPAVAGRQRWLDEGARFAAAAGMLAVLAATFAAYVLPDRAGLASVGFVAVVWAADACGLPITRGSRRWIGGLLVVAAVALVAVCLAVPPVAGPPAPSTPGGLPLAAAVLFPFLAGGARRPWPLAGSIGVGLAVGTAALYQLGPARLGLSPTSIRDLLSAADARALDVALALAVTLATVPAALLVLGAARRRAGDSAGAGARAGAALPAAALAAVAAAALPPFDVLLLAAAAALLAALMVNLLRLRGSRNVPALLGAGLAAVLAASVPVAYLGLAVVACGLGVGLVAARYRGRRD